MPKKPRKSIQTFKAINLENPQYFNPRFLTHKSFETKHTENLLPEFQFFLALIGNLYGLRICWWETMRSDNRTIKTFKAYGPKLSISTLNTFMGHFFIEYEDYINFWRKKHFYRRMVKLRTEGRLYGNLPKRKEFVRIKTEIFLEYYINFLYHQLAKRKSIGKINIDCYINTYIKEVHPRHTIFKPITKNVIYINRFIN